MIHGDRSQSQRTSALTGFQQGRFRVLVATDLLRAGFTYRTSHTSSITICLRWRRILSTALGERDATADTVWLQPLFVKEQRSNYSPGAFAGHQRSSACADETSSLPEKKDRNPVNLPAFPDRKPVNLLLWSPPRCQSDLCFPASFSRRI